MEFLKKKRISLLQLLILAVCVAAIVSAALLLPPLFKSDAALYKAAVSDAMTVEEDETQHELVTLTSYQNDKVKWNEVGDRCLLLFWHSSPELYAEGEEITFSFGDVFAYSETEFKMRYDECVKGSSDPIRRIRQLLGLSPSFEGTHFTSVWIEPASVRRPAYNPDAENPVIYTSFGESMNDVAYLDWFNTRLISAYFEDSIPWTRLGYTYDWARGSGEYGLTEFFIPNGASAVVHDTQDNETFIANLKLSESIEP